MLTLGTTDKCRVFHPFGFAMTTNETESDFEFYFAALRDAVKLSTGHIYQPTKLIADNAPAIHNGFIKCNYSVVLITFSSKKLNYKVLEIFLC